MRIALMLIGLTAVLLLASCGGDDDGDGSGGRLRVVATTTQLADFARQVGGDRVEVDTILGADVDPHDYEPRPSDARALAGADVVLQSGGDADAWLDDVLDAAGGDARRLVLIDTVRTLEAGGDDGAPDPHWWQDPRNAEVAVARIAVAFAEAAPAGADAFERRARAYGERIRELDGRIEECVETVPEDERTLVTGHDAFRYLAERYGIEVVGSVLPSRSTASQPSARDVRELVRAIRREGVETIFPESALNVRLERAVARDAGVEVGEPLHADTLGPAGSEGGAYLGALRHDAFAIARGFGARCGER